MKIDKPGIYDIPAADYFADPCPTPSLTQSLAKIILEQSPLHAWYEHPRLNPDYQADDDTKYDVGNIAHRLLIGSGKDITVVEGYDDWRTRAAQEKRREAAAAGKLGVLAKHFSRAEKMARAAREALDLRELGHLFRDGGGAGEVTIAWKEGDIWLRQMLDWLTPDQLTYIDLKTTDMSASPLKLATKMVTDGWHIQAAMAERGLAAVDPDNPGRRKFLFVCQETSPPYALTVARLSEAVLTMGRKQLAFAINRWAECMASNVFPSYPLEVVTPAFPGWMEQQWLARELEEEDARPRRGLAPPLDEVFAGG